MRHIFFYMSSLNATYSLLATVEYFCTSRRLGKSDCNCTFVPNYCGSVTQSERLSFFSHHFYWPGYYGNKIIAPLQPCFVPYLGCIHLFCPVLDRQKAGNAVFHGIQVPYSSGYFNLQSIIDSLFQTKIRVYIVQYTNNSHPDSWFINKLMF